MADLKTRSLAVRVIAVVVSYNRRLLLEETLAALVAQTRPADEVLVIDNDSSDGAPEMVAERYPAVRLTRLPRNTGGAGGFAAGMAQAIASGADAVWLMDDDTVPDAGALAELLRARRSSPEGSVLWASAVRWTDGRRHPMNTPRVRPFSRPSAVARARARACYPIRSASFVSLLVDAGAIRAHGLPIASYFLWNDDFEFTARILRHGRGYVCERSTVEHRTRSFTSAFDDPGPRFYYEVRNKIWLVRFSSALAPIERIIYSTVAVVRWSSLVARSTGRLVLLAAFARAWKDARTRPVEGVSP